MNVKYSTVILKKFNELIYGEHNVENVVWALDEGLRSIAFARGL